MDDFHARRARDFPFFARKIFLTHASVSPLPAAARDAIADYAARISTEGQFDSVHDAIYRCCKERAAALLRENGAPAHAAEIAFAGSTSHALGLVATSLDWQAGENCVVADGDFPANILVWKNLHSTHGVETRMIPYRPRMEISLDDIIPLVNEKTRLVSLASCNFLSGFPPDLNAIGRWLRERGVLLCVDAIQTLGAVRADFSEVDFVCADAHKWLLGPNGIALLWARSEVLKTMRPAIFGWLAGQNRDDWFAYDLTPIANAERFEPGARNYLGVVGLDASLGVLQSAGTEEIENRVVHLRNYAAQKISDRGFEILWRGDADQNFGQNSGIVSFRANNDEATVALYHKLEEKFALSLRTDKTGASWIRVSPHFMNCEEDVVEMAAAANA